MKMAKKLLAVILAGVLALSVLTGCSGAVSAKTIAEAMSDMSEEGVVYKADPELRQIAEKIVKPPAAMQEGETDIYDKIMKIMGDDYVGKYVWIAVTATEGGNVTAQARNLLEDVDEDEDSNINSAVPNGTSPANDRYIGTVTATMNGVDCLFAVIIADAVQDKV